MATFHERVQDYVGEFADVDAMTLWLREAVRKILEYLPPERAEPFLVSATFSSGNLAINDKRVFSVLVDGRMARKVPVALAYDILAGSFSLYEATSRDPAYYVNTQYVYYSPSTGTGTVYYITYPDLTLKDTTETTPLPLFVIEPIVLDVACRVKQRQIDDLVVSGDTTLVWTAPTPPSLPTSPTIAEIIAAITAIVSPADITVATWSTGSLASVSPNPLANDLTTDWTDLTGYLKTSKDIELAQAKIQEIQTKIQDYLSRLSVYMEEQKQETAIVADARKTDVQLEYQALVDKATSLLRAYAEQMTAYVAQLNSYAAQLNAEAARYNQLREYLKQKIASMQMEYMVLKSRYDEALYLLMGVRMPQPETKQ